jgi:hypothetical protein
VKIRSEDWGREYSHKNKILGVYGLKILRNTITKHEKNLYLFNKHPPNTTLSLSSGWKMTGKTV